ncbi:MAG: glucose-1-phosphate cytidylyltransferase [Candidatus Margulisiibacteriota bacterium]
MKCVILAGGLGTRLSEETVLRPKPMVEIGGKPMLWHIMKYFASYGVTEFIICLGYKGYIIKEYFLNYGVHRSDITVDLATNTLEIHNNQVEPWKVTLIDTGEATMTGGRLKRIAPYLEDTEPFFFTYGDGVSTVDLDALSAFHRAHGKLATVTAVQPPGRFGALKLGQKGHVERFQEKPDGDGGRINGGFFVLSKAVLPYIASDNIIWEQEPLQQLTLDRQLMAFDHDGFWQPMDTLREKAVLETLWNSGQAPWKRWP